MNIINVKDYETMSCMAADIIAEQIKKKPNSVLGFATGSTPIGLYKQLISRFKNGESDFSLIKTVNLDEYVGLDAENDQSYRYFMNNNLFNYININKENTFLPNGKAEDTKKECENYDKRITEFGGTDIQVLGIGNNGHIGFNEPDSVFTKETHIVYLKEDTIKANSRFFASENDVPKAAITMGMGGIMSAKKILFLANGKGKKDIVKRAFSGPITPEVPASILQLHPDVTVIYSEN